MLPKTVGIVAQCNVLGFGVLGEKPLRAEKRTNDKLNPQMVPSPGIHSKPHSWEPSALTTVPSLLWWFLVLPCVLALCCVLALSFCIVFILAQFPQTSSALLYPYLQCVHSAATAAEVRPLATVIGLSTVCASRLQFQLQLTEQLVAGLLGIGLPSLYISWQQGVVIVFHVCCHVCSFYCQLLFFFFFNPLFEWFSLLLLLLILFYFSLFSWASTECLSVLLVAMFVLS